MTEDVRRCIQELRNVSYSQCEDYSVYVIALAMVAADKLESLSAKLENITRARDEWKDTALKAQECLRAKRRVAMEDFYE